MTGRMRSLIFTLLFFAVCLVPAAGLALGAESKAGANEVLAVRPALTKRDGSLNPDYLPELADYVGDRFFLRGEAVTARAKLSAALFHTSVTEDVIMGRGGWLYYAPTLGDYTRTARMSGREVWCAARTLYLLQENVESRGGRFLFTVAPNKNSLYSEAMPVYPVADGPSNAEALRNALSSMGVHTADLFSAFEREDGILYFPTDSHWNGKGAALAADTILSALDIESDYYSGPFTEGAHKGDLYEMLFPAGTDPDPDPAYAPGFRFTANTANPDNARIRAQGPGNGSLFLYRDSFGRNLYPYLAESFAESEFSRRNEYDPSVLPENGVLVIELVERNLRYLNDYTHPVPAPARDAELVSGASDRGRISVREENGTVFSGTVSDVRPDDDSPVYIVSGGSVYEAVPKPDGFAAILPEGACAGDLRAVFLSDGVLVSLSATDDLISGG